MTDGNVIPPPSDYCDVTEDFPQNTNLKTGTHIL